MTKDKVRSQLLISCAVGGAVWAVFMFLFSSVGVMSIPAGIFWAVLMAISMTFQVNTYMSRLPEEALNLNQSHSFELPIPIDEAYHLAKDALGILKDNRITAERREGTSARIETSRTHALGMIAQETVLTLEAINPTATRIVINNHMRTRVPFAIQADVQGIGWHAVQDVTQYLEVQFYPTGRITAAA